MAKEKVTFKHENGFCPSFIYQDTDFFIKDSKGTQGKNVYTLYSKKLNSVTYMDFDTEKAAKNYVQEKRARFISESGKRLLYASVFHDYIIDGKKIIIRLSSVPVSGEFDRYADCLKFSKEYITQLMTKK